LEPAKKYRDAIRRDAGPKYALLYACGGVGVNPDRVPRR
jgi:hypothetical protein